MNQVLVDFVGETLMWAYCAYLTPGACLRLDDLEGEVNRLITLYQQGQADPFYDLKVRVQCRTIRALVTG